MRLYGATCVCGDCVAHVATIKLRQRLCGSIGANVAHVETVWLMRRLCGSCGNCVAHVAVVWPNW